MSRCTLHISWTSLGEDVLHPLALVRNARTENHQILAGGQPNLGLCIRPLRMEREKARVKLFQDGVRLGKSLGRGTKGGV